MTSPDPLLRVGDPDKDPKGATYTLFIMPFGARPQRIGRYEGDVFYQPMAIDGSDWVRRQRYFTFETGEVLYRRATWFEIAPARWGRADYPTTFQLKHSNRNRELQVEIAPPRLIVFEWNRKRPSQGGDVFNTGFLVLRLHFAGSEGIDERAAPHFSDLLLLNDRFRFSRAKFNEHFKDQIRPTFDEQQWQTQCGFFLDRWERLLRLPLKLGDGNFWRVFPETDAQEAKDWWNMETGCPTEHRELEGAGWICNPDDRAFVWTCAVVEGGFNAIIETKVSQHNESGRWIKLLNVDPPPWEELDDNEASPYEQDWAETKAYKRWLHYGTLYGFNYHSGAMLCGPCEEPPITKHFGENYFDIALLLLYLRISLFRFSRKLSELSADARDRNSDRNGAARDFEHGFDRLRRDFAHFTNLYKFPLISNQQQALEMYQQVRAALDVDDLFDDVDNQIRNSHEFADAQLQAEQARSTERLTYIATGALVPTLAAGILGMNFDSLPSTIEDWVRPVVNGLGMQTQMAEYIAGFVLVGLFSLVFIFVLARLFAFLLPGLFNLFGGGSNDHTRSRRRR